MRVQSGVVLLGLAIVSASLSPGQEPMGFVGHWRQDLADTSPKPKSRIPKELVIKLDGDTLMVTMKGPGKVHSVDVTFRIGGPEVTYTGLDGDEFHIKAIRDGNSLVFDGSEHENGSDRPVHKVWTLRNKSEGQVLVETKTAKDPAEPAKVVAEYERVKP
jgi:endonuclease YncB( thermonuclease family)